jgi:hypothetical protein
VFGRAPSAEERQAGRAFLAGEASKQYEERRSAAAVSKDPPGEAAAGEGPGVAAPDDDPAAAGMMAGVAPGRDAPADEKKKMRPVTAFGRYVKVLLSSNEFVFVS